MIAPTRQKESLTSLFQKNETDEITLNLGTILTAASDEGVRINGGRPGSRFAPTCLINNIKKLTTTHEFPLEHIEVHNVWEERADLSLHAKQLLSAKLISEHIQRLPTMTPILHIGGGHDHAYPLLMGYEMAGIKKIIIINVDAHADTRIDPNPHSGTPFRQLDKDLKIPVTLWQYGLHDFANSKSTLSQLYYINEYKSFFSKLAKDTNHFTRLPELLLHRLIGEYDDTTLFYFSLDADAIESSTMEAVSAVNHDGLPLLHIKELMRAFFELAPNARHALGIYEYNPIFDNLSQKGSRALSSLIFDFWTKKDPIH